VLPLYLRCSFAIMACLATVASYKVSAGSVLQGRWRAASYKVSAGGALLFPPCLASAGILQGQGRRCSHPCSRESRSPGQGILAGEASCAGIGVRESSTGGGQPEERAAPCPPKVSPSLPLSLSLLTHQAPESQGEQSQRKGGVIRGASRKSAGAGAALKRAQPSAGGEAKPEGYQPVRLEFRQAGCSNARRGQNSVRADLDRDPLRLRLIPALELKHPEQERTIQRQRKQQTEVSRSHGWAQPEAASGRVAGFRLG